MPRLPRAVPRERLFSWLKRHHEYPLIWIKGPPGSGKTTIVASYFEQSPRSVLWYRADEGDADLSTVFHNLREAMRSIRGPEAEQLPLLTPEYLLDIPTFTRNFVRTLFRLLPAPGAIVLDNLQDAGGRALDLVLGTIVTEVPQAVQIITISRSEPPQAIEALQVKGMLAILDWTELRLTLQEAGEIAGREGYSDATLVGDLYARCDGWVAGFNLLIQHSKRLNAATSQAAETRSALFNYFTGELFASALPMTQHFLICTALLPNFTLTQAAAYTTRELAQEIINRLLKHNFFIDRLGGEEPVYRYHDLFREFLLDRGRTASPPGERRTLLITSAHSAERVGQPEAALTLVLEAEAWVEAVRLICSLAPGVLRQGRNSTLERWIDVLPGDVIEEHAWLRYWQGVARMPRAPAAARKLLERAYTSFQSLCDGRGCLLACAGILQSFFFAWDDLRPLDSWLDEFQSLLQQDREHISTEIEQQILPCVMSAIFRCPNHPLVHSCVQRALQLMAGATEQQPNIELAILPLHYFFATGQWMAGGRLLQQLEHNLDQASVSPQLVLHLSAYKIMWSTFCPALFSESDGEASLKRFIELADSSGIRIVDTLGYGLGVYFALSRNNLALADKLLNSMKAQRALQGPGYEGHLAALLACVSLARGNATVAESYARMSLQTSQSIGVTMGVIGTQIFLAQIHIMREAYQAALDEAEQIVADSRSHELLAYCHAGLLLKSYALFKMGCEQAGVEKLSEALVLGRTTDQASIMPWGLPAITSYLYSVALERGIETEYVRGLIKLLGIHPPSAAVAAWPWPLRIYTLGRFALVRHGVAIKMTRKVQKKPLQLLQALIALGGRSVPIDSLVRQVWPRQEAAAKAALHVALTRLRRLLGEPQALVLTAGKLTLDDRMCWVDVWAFERGVADDKMDSALELYRGPFLAGDNEPACVGRMRERLLAKFQRVALHAGKKLEHEGELDGAADVYRQALERDVCNEEFFRRLMYCEWKLGRRAAAIRHYQRCRDLLAQQFRAKPSLETEKLYQRIRSE